jgi:hypothetical protein
MTPALPARVNDAGVAAMNRGERTSQAVRIGGHQHKMDVDRHQAPAPNLDVGGAAALPQEIAVERIIGVGKEHARPSVAALRDMMWDDRERQRGPDEPCNIISPDRQDVN